MFVAAGVEGDRRQGSDQGLAPHRSPRTSWTSAAGKAVVLVTTDIGFWALTAAEVEARRAAAEAEVIAARAEAQAGAADVATATTSVPRNPGGEEC
jgi:hypothetical protein